MQMQIQGETNIAIIITSAVDGGTGNFFLLVGENDLIRFDLIEQ